MVNMVVHTHNSTTQEAEEKELWFESQPGI